MSITILRCYLWGDKLGESIYKEWTSSIPIIYDYAKRIWCSQVLADVVTLVKLKLHYHGIKCCFLCNLLALASNIYHSTIYKKRQKKSKANG